MKNSPGGFETDAIHAGEVEFSASTPIHLGATTNAVYYRTSNPTCAAFEEKICTLDGGLRSVAMACGMAAVSHVLLALLRAGGRLVCHRSVYTWTRELVQNDLPRFGVEVEVVDMRDAAALGRALDKGADVVYFEPLSNPLFDIIDTPAVIHAAHRVGARAVVDDTWLSPYLFRPLEHGADVVLHSATKYLCGHGDALAGVLSTRDPELAEELVRVRNTFGGILSPMNAYLLLRGIKTLPLRMEQHCRNAQAIATFLDAHAKVARVWYPGLPGTPGHEIACEQWRGFGGMLGFETIDESSRERLVDRIALCKPWVSLGDAASLVVGIRGHERLVRMSVGLETVDDIIADLEQALG